MINIDIKNNLLKYFETVFPSKSCSYCDSNDYLKYYENITEKTVLIKLIGFTFDNISERSTLLNIEFQFELQFLAGDILTEVVQLVENIGNTNRIKINENIYSNLAINNYREELFKDSTLCILGFSI